MPPRIISARPKRVPARTNSSETFFASAGKDKLRQPLLKIEVVRQASEQSHRHVSVPVDQTGNDDLVAGIYRLIRAESSDDISTLSHGDDAAILNRHTGVLDDAMALVHGYERAVQHQQIDGVHTRSPPLCGRREGRPNNRSDDYDERDKWIFSHSMV